MIKSLLLCHVLGLLLVTQKVRTNGLSLCVDQAPSNDVAYNSVMHQQIILASLGP